MIKVSTLVESNSLLLGDVASIRSRKNLSGHCGVEHRHQNGSTNLMLYTFSLERKDNHSRGRGWTRTLSWASARSGYITIAVSMVVVIVMICVINLTSPTQPNRPVPSTAPESKSSLRLARASALGSMRLRPATLRSDRTSQELERMDKFITSTGITDSKVIKSFAAADGNRDNLLSWNELDVFQTAINRAFVIKKTEKNLRPDEFMSTGGGDATDWVLVTAAFLQYWGSEPYIGTILTPGNATPQAVCLIRMKSPPESTNSYFTTGPNQGYFVPIPNTQTSQKDIAEGTLLRIDTPEVLYGQSK